MRLIDTSAWIHALRVGGNPEVRARVRALLEAGEAAWCPMIQLELWNGARGAHEKRLLTEMQGILAELAVDAKVWAVAHALAQASRRTGKTIPATDILIAACGRRHGVEIEHADQHFATLASLAA